MESTSKENRTEISHYPMWKHFKSCLSGETLTRFNKGNKDKQSAKDLACVLFVIQFNKQLELFFLSVWLLRSKVHRKEFRRKARCTSSFYIFNP